MSHTYRAMNGEIHLVSEPGDEIWVEDSEHRLRVFLVLEDGSVVQLTDPEITQP